MSGVNTSPRPCFPYHEAIYALSEHMQAPNPSFQIMHPHDVPFKLNVRTQLLGWSKWMDAASGSSDLVRGGGGCYRTWDLGGDGACALLKYSSFLFLMSFWSSEVYRCAGVVIKIEV